MEKKPLEEQSVLKKPTQAHLTNRVDETHSTRTLLGKKKTPPNKPRRRNPRYKPF